MHWKDERETTIQNCLGNKLTWFKSSPQYRALYTIDGEPMEFENIFPRIHHIAALLQSPRVPVNTERRTRRFQRTNYLHVDVQRHLMGSKDNEHECDLSANLVSIYEKRFSPGRWSFLGPGSEKKWYSTHDSKPQGEWDRVAELTMIKCSESGDPVFRATSPLSRGTLKSKRDGKLSLHFCADEGTIETVFRTIIFGNQLSIYGGVSDLCEEYKSCHVRTGRFVLVGQSDPLFVPTSSLMKTPKPRLMILRKKIFPKVPRTSGKAITTKSCD